ncbi:hypothetical protein BaRGS_00013115 [Batillaria attramentaria]|uniref:Thioesterase domain-containing protein n=1 Tax=Batillaria attramentaria TaxID=370345 RepID=A0ABD0L852_9CAEN
MVLIDPATRRPTPIPDDWRQHYAPLCVRHQPLIVPRQSPPQPPRPDHAYTTTVAWSDVDDNDHTNFTSYVRFAVDALHHASKTGLLDGCLTKADISAGASEVKVAYLGESGDGDVLHVHVWCQRDVDRTVVCSMDRDTEPVCQVTLSFHPSH